jgi:DNA-binding NtrC family response regulator
MTHRHTPLDLTTTFTADLESLAPELPPVVTAPRFLLLLSGRGGVQVEELGPAATRIVGRAAPADLIVDDPSLSRRHARLHTQQTGVLVEDLGSKNGTSCDGEAIESVLVRPGMQARLGGVVLTVRRASELERRGFDDFERFLGRIDDELLRARTFGRPMSLLMLRALSVEPDDAWWLRVRAELRAIDTIAVYAPGVVLVLLPELTPAETRLVASELARKRADEPTLVCGVATLQEGAQTSHALLEAASRAARTANRAQQVVQTPSSDAADGEPLILNPAMRELYRLARRVASHAAPVLILGETGTGKELIARHIHEAGARRDEPFRAINCSAIPASLLESVLFGHERGAFTGANEARKGIFEEADGGTLFLDEIGELPLLAQAALLRVLETKQLTRVGGTRVIEVDVRCVSATHCDLEAMIANKTFRSDLFHRLNLLTLQVPPLRERRDEIEALAMLFLRASASGACAGPRSFSSDALKCLCAYAWPGNVRELRNVVERAALLCEGPDVSEDALPERMRVAVAATSTADDKRAGSGGRFATMVRSYETQLITEALAATAGNQTKAAELLGMPLRTLVYKLRSFGLRAGSRFE